MHLKHAAPLIALVLSNAAFAQSCEENFLKKGSPLTGTKYTSSVTVADLTVAGAMAQMHGIALKGGYDIISEDVENGNMLAEQRSTNTTSAIPLIITAADEGGKTRVDMQVKLGGAVFAKAEAIKAEMCKMLDEVKGGKEGKAAAAKGKAAVGTNSVTKIDAMMLSLQLAREAKSNPAIIGPRYKGRVFTLKGRVSPPTENGGVYSVMFEIPQPHEMVIKPGPLDPQFKVDVFCALAKNQTAYALSMRGKERVTLTGTFAAYDDLNKLVLFKDCKPE